MKNKIVIAVLCVLLCSFTVVSVISANAATFVTDSEWKLEIASDTEYYIEEYLGSEANFTLPEQIGTRKVVKINSRAFSDAPVVNLVIPDSYTVIGDYAFIGNETLKTVTIPNTVTEVGAGVFSNCKVLETVTFTEPAAFESITASFFSGCSSIEEIVIPNGVKNIYNYAFLNCNSLVKLVVPASVDNIASKAFNKCPNVTLYVYDDSYALQYAINNNIPYVNLGAYTEPTEPATATELTTTEQTYTSEVSTSVSATVTDATEVTSSTAVIESSTVTDATEPATATDATEPSEVTIPSTEVTSSTATGETSTAAGESATATDATEPQSSSADVSSTATESASTSSVPQSSTQGSSDGHKSYQIGDADLDGRITIKDATIIQKHIAKLLTLDDVSLKLADTNNDAVVSVKDATQIQKFIAGFKDILYVGDEVKL